MGIRLGLELGLEACAPDEIVDGFTRRVILQTFLDDIQPLQYLVEIRPGCNS
jgi:hypothetical protein